MKRKWIVLFIVILMIILSIMLRFFYQSEKSIVNYIEHYLYARYDRNFELVESIEVKHGKKSYLFTTTDDRKICFEVTYWVGAMSTPWGQQPLIQTRHIIEDFPKAISDYVVSQSPYARYNITDIPLHEVVDNLSSMLTEAKSYLNEYGALSDRPELELVLLHNNKEFKMTFRHNDKESIKEGIIRTVFQEE